MPTSVMPKGVEHFTKGLPIHIGRSMPTSVMPKGVEHSSGFHCRGSGSDAHLCDAERR